MSVTLDRIGRDARTRAKSGISHGATRVVISLYAGGGGERYSSRRGTS